MRLRLLQIPAATEYCCWLFCLFQHALARRLADARSIHDCGCLGTAVLLAGSPSFESVPDQPARLEAPKEGATAAALRSARGVPQAGFASGSLPLSPTTRITNTLVRAIGQHSRPIVLLGRHVMR